MSTSRQGLNSNSGDEVIVDLEQGLNQEDERSSDDDFIIDSSELTLVPANPLNRGQRFLNGVSDFATNVAWVTAIDGNWRDAAMPEYDLGVPLYDVVKTGITIGVHEASQITYAFTRKESPLNYLFFAGDGSLALGLAREGGKRLIATVPPVAFHIGVAFGRDALMTWASDFENPHPYVVLPLIYMRTPVMDAIFNVATTRALYAGSQKLAEKVFPSLKSPEVYPEQNPDLYWFQHILDGGARTLDAVAFVEMMRQVFNTFGPAIILHSEHSLMLAPLIDLMVMEPLRYVSQTPHPFRQMDVPCGPRRHRAVLLNEDGGEDEPLLEVTNDEREYTPSRGRQAGAVAIRAGVALGVLTALTFTNMYLAAQMPQGEGDENNQMVDPSAWSMHERLVYEVALAAGGIFLNGLANKAVELIGKCASYLSSFSLFGGRQNNGVERDRENDDEYDINSSDPRFVTHNAV